MQYYAVEQADNDSLDAWLAKMGENAQLMPPAALRQFRLRVAAGAGGFLLVGTAERIAERLAMLSHCGIDGVLLTWVDYIDGLQRFNEILPLLERRGLRQKFCR